MREHCGIYAGDDMMILTLGETPGSHILSGREHAGPGDAAGTEEELLGRVEEAISRLRCHAVSSSSR